MRLELFDLLDQTCDLMKLHEREYQEAEMRIIHCMRRVLESSEDRIVEMSSRIKTLTSLREKIVRYKLYQHVESSEEILDSLHDIVGITIKCQFIKDERIVFDLIKSLFKVKGAEGRYYHPDYPDILLDLSAPQPQLQKNGYTIYRIDGYCVINGKKINFELQIKAMVYTFWSEIEHKIVYKNNHYSLNNVFMTDMLSTVRNSLTSIDSQLNIIYNEMQFQSHKKRELDEHAIKRVIAKSINDLFIDKIKESIGFTINFKKTCDILSDFLYNRQQSEFVISEKTVFLHLQEKIQEIKNRQVDFESAIEFKQDIVSEDRFTQIISKAFLIFMHSDFEWYVFFRMLFELLPAKNDDDFEYFITLYRSHLINSESFDNISEVYNEEQCQYIIEDIMAQCAHTLVDIGTISILYEDKLHEVAYLIEEFTRIFVIELKDFDTWERSKAFLLDDLSKKIKAIFE
ncbi:MAG: hypothetical protein E7191_07870 [Erysipelotrichaceae bacterium]|nr:hypothetical protein [Erysipelotrichaceae bacterium]MBR3694182.1 hypothetical protein [Erysipelotrichales bacterium]